MGWLQVVAVVGPTTAGKSELGLALARELGGEVVSADSMQLYHGMDIGTAKLSEPERCGVPHHLLDVWSVRDTANVAAYQRMAREVIDGLLARDRVAVLAGGSGLYVRAAVDDLDFPGTDPDVRARLEGELARVGAPALHERLQQADPKAAEVILPSNGRRIVRALEAVEVTGRSFTATLPGYHSLYDAVQLGLEVPREDLDERIERRVEAMWRAGFVDEVRALERQGLREGLTASRALGYAQVLRYLAGECSEQRAMDETVRGTKRLARRQQAWFRRDPRVHWLRYDRTDLLQAALSLVRQIAAARETRSCD